ncbi:Ig-like domain-containing protein [Vreelandella utahensis]|uniref:Ig-like domain-containing protein n=1 Tax=Vreelandella halophila TaxID=86177 RepID=UPI0015C406C1|nr:Ig-like domain-containing protein [Halomonas utahensis]
MPFWTKRLLVLCLSLLLVACGTDEESGENAGEPDDNPDGTAEVASLDLLLEGNSLDAAGENSITALAVARDSNNRAISGADVTFSTEDGGLLIEASDSVTNEQGSAEATVSNRFDPNTRQTQITALIEGTDISDTINLEVEGGSINVSGPTNLTLNDSGTYTVTVRDSEDSSGEPVSGIEVNVSSENDNGLNVESATTDNEGQVNFELSADVAGTDTLTISTLGTQTEEVIQVSSDDIDFISPQNDQLNITDTHTFTAQWISGGNAVDGKSLSFTTSRGEITTDSTPTVTGGRASVDIESSNTGSATIVARNDEERVSASKAIRFVSDQPDSISVQASPSAIAPNQDSTANRSVITATVRDENGNVVSGETVDFTIVEGPGSLADDGIADTDQSGSASVEYIASEFATQFEGVTIRAQVDANSTINTSVPLTVADSSFITVGSGGNIVEEGQERYRVPHTIQVTKSDGSPAANTDVSLELQTTEVIVGDDWSFDNNEEVWVAPANTTTCTIGTDIDESFGTATVVAADDTETTDNSGSVQVTTNDQGYADIAVLYPRNHAFWSRIELVGSADVGSEYRSRASLSFRLPFPADVLEDTAAPPFVTSPFNDDYDTSCNEL